MPPIVLAKKGVMGGVLHVVKHGGAAGPGPCMRHPPAPPPPPPPVLKDSGAGSATSKCP